MRHDKVNAYFVLVLVIVLLDHRSMRDGVARSRATSPPRPSSPSGKEGVGGRSAPVACASACRVGMLVEYEHEYDYEKSAWCNMTHMPALPPCLPCIVGPPPSLPPCPPLRSVHRGRGNGYSGSRVVSPSTCAHRITLVQNRDVFPDQVGFDCRRRAWFGKSMPATAARPHPGLKATPPPAGEGNEGLFHSAISKNILLGSSILDSSDT
jgi:hypothetical protein